MTEHNIAAALVIADSVSGYIDSFTSRIIQSAARRASAALSGRLEEEWLADLSEQRGRMTRLKFAFGCYWAALAISWDNSTVTGAASSSVASTNTVTYALHGPSLQKPRMTTATPDNVMCDINTTPLIDVMLVLLVTLIVSLPVMTHAVKLDLPQAPPLSEKIPPVDLEIDYDGTVVWNGTALVSWEQLESYLRTESQKSPQPEIHLRPDRRVRYDAVVKVLAAAQRNRMQKIGFVDTAEFKD